jgi:hypothetical protein
VKTRGLTLSGKVDARFVKGDARSATQKVHAANFKGKTLKKSATRGLTLSGKVDARFLKGDARSASQRSRRTSSGRVNKKYLKGDARSASQKRATLRHPSRLT